MFEARRGLNGELPRLPFPALVILMAITGFAEELLYRYAAIGLLTALIGCALPGGIATAQRDGVNGSMRSFCSPAVTRRTHDV